MPAGRVLIVNADDFGLTPGVTRGIIEAHERGIVTSTSLMVRREAAEAAAEQARAHPELAVGLHVELGEWVWSGGAWNATLALAPLDDPDAVAAEVDGQLRRFRELLGREPTHVDSHQHVHLREPVRRVLAAIAGAAGVPLRQVTPRIRYEGAFYGQDHRGRPFPDGVSVESLLALLAALPPGITELGCHPGYAGGLDSPYGAEREVELATLTDPRVRAAIREHGITLASFASIREVAR